MGGARRELRPRIIGGETVCLAVELEGMGNGNGPGMAQGFSPGGYRRRGCLMQLASFKHLYQHLRGANVFALTNSAGQVVRIPCRNSRRTGPVSVPSREIIYFEVNEG